MKGKEWASECGTVLPDKTTFGPGERQQLAQQVNEVP